MSRISALEDLFVSLFTPDELHSFLRRRDETADVLQSVPWGNAPRILAADVVAALERRGLIRQGLFDALATDNTFRRDDIAQVAGEWGFTLPSPLSNPQPPADPRQRRRALRADLVHLFPDQDTARMIAEDCGLRVRRINFQGQPEIVWDRVIREAARPAGTQPV